MTSDAGGGDLIGARPDEPRLAEIAAALEQTRSAAALCDSEWALVWVSEELRILLGDPSDDDLGVGRHLLDAYLSEVWATKISTDTQYRMFMEHFPLFITDTPGGKETLQKIFAGAVARWSAADGANPNAIEVPDVFQAMEATDPPMIWTDRIEFLQGDLPPNEVVEVAVRLRDDAGALVGTAFIYSSGLPARVLALVARGDEQMYRRMARLIEPGRRSAAILFADLQASATLSRRLPSAAYFKLVRAITTAIDEVVIRHGGIVGKHAGDGATAFFLADDLGSPSRAARAAVCAARAVTVAARDAGKAAGEEAIPVDECVINVGLHWGGTLYMGQLVTGGRLEVTALGDEVNECARIQQCASDGAILVSKTLIEHLEPEDAGAADLDPDGVIYRMLGELSGASDKAKRDAGTIPVTRL